MLHMAPTIQCIVVVPPVPLYQEINESRLPGLGVVNILFWDCERHWIFTTHQVFQGYLVNCNSACQWYQQTTHLGCELRSSAAMIVAWFTFVFVSTTWYGSTRLRHRNLCECAIFSYLFNDSITTKLFPSEVPENPPFFCDRRSSAGRCNCRSRIPGEMRP